MNRFASLLAMPEAFLPWLRGRAFSIERIDDHRDRHAMEVAYDATGLATVMADGDLVRVFLHRSHVYQDSRPARQYCESRPLCLARGDAYQRSDSGHRLAYHTDYWWKRAQLGLPAPEFEPIPGFNNLRQPLENRAITMDRSLQEGGRVSLRLGCSRISLGCSRISLGCSRISLGCSRISLGCSRISLGCSRISLGCSRIKISIRSSGPLAPPWHPRRPLPPLKYRPRSNELRFEHSLPRSTGILPPSNVSTRKR